MKLIYWDIDGTMINTGKAGMYAIYDVFHRLMGDDRAVPNISAGGRTDNYICQQLLYQARGVMPTDEEVFAFAVNTNGIFCCGCKRPVKKARFYITYGKTWNILTGIRMWYSF